MEDTEMTGPFHTLYINNLNEKIAQEDLKKAMRSIFSQFGNITDVVSRRTYKLRGQAWVVFEDPASAEKARETMQGFPFLNKPLRIAYARSKSDALAKLDGSYREDEIEERKKRRREARAAQQPIAPTVPRGAGGPPAASAKAQGPNCTLFVENLPHEANEAMLLLVFQKFPGLKEVRLIPHRPGIAFIEYDNEPGAMAALQGLQGFKLATDKPMHLSFAKQ